MSRISIPTTAALPHGHRLPGASLEVLKILSKLSRPSLISLALEWLEAPNLQHCAPFTTKNLDDDEEEDAPYDAVQSHEELREVYEDLSARRGSKREIIDRITEGDWRHGLSLYQIAMAESRSLLDHPASQRWHALKLSMIGDTTARLDSAEKSFLPRFHAPAFLLNLQRELGSITKAHYYLDRIDSRNISFLRVQIHDSPYNTQRSLQDAAQHRQTVSDASKSCFFIFPDGSPFVYVSLAGAPSQLPGSEGRSLRKVVIEAVAKALSRPQARYTLQTTSLAAKSLDAILALRGLGRSNGAAGGWSIFAEDSFGHGALDYVYATNGTPQTASDDASDANKENSHPILKRQQIHVDGGMNNDHGKKRRKVVAEGRFAKSGLEDDGKGLDRFEVRISDSFAGSSTGSKSGVPGRQNTTTQGRVLDRDSVALITSSTRRQPEEDGEPPNLPEDDWKPEVRLTFHGSHVFAGIRQLVEQGVIDGEKMPGWMTGEAGVSIGVVKDGRMLTKDYV